MILEQYAALLLERGLNDAREHAEHAGEQHLQVNLGFHDVDGRRDVLPHGGNLEIELVASPAGLNVSAARNMLLELVEIVGDAPPGFVLAEVVRQVDIDGLSHICDVARRSPLFKAYPPSIITDMFFRRLALLALVIPPPVGAAQLASSVSILTEPQQSDVSTKWDPAAPYIAVGQDEAGYRSWYLAASSRAAQVRGFNDYLAANAVSGVLPTWQLLRTATSWRDCGAQPFEVPPAEEWPHMVQTLRFVRDFVITAVGPVEAVSVYRNPQLNQCAGGAPESAHKEDSAIDLVPLQPIDRISLMRKLCGAHTDHGAAYNAGLGFYAYLRFHVDGTKFRRWNMDPAVAAECPPIIHPEDIASVGQPLPSVSAVPASPVSSSVPARTSSQTSASNQSPQ